MCYRAWNANSLEPCNEVSPRIVKAPSKLISPVLTILVAKDTGPVPVWVNPPTVMVPVGIIKRLVLAIAIVPDALMLDPSVIADPVRLISPK